MSINLGLDGLRKAVIRSNLFLNDLPGETKSLGNAMFQQRVELLASVNRARAQTRNDKSALKASKERLQQIDRQRSDERRQQASARRQTLSKGLDNVGQRYQAGKAVVDKVSSVSSRAMSVASFGAKLLKPGYEQATGTAQVSEAADAAVAPQADNLAGDIGQLNSAIDSISLTVFTQLDGTLRSLTQTATGMLSGVDEWIKDNPTLAGGITQLVAGGGLLIAALGGIGSVVVPVLSGLNLLMAGAGILSSVFTFAGGAIAAALGAITLPIGIVIAAIAGAAMAVYYYWEPISAFFAGLVKGMSETLGPVGEMFTPVGALFDNVSNVLSGMYDAFWKLLEPVTLTGETLNKVAFVGEVVGKVLASAFMVPTKIINSLTSKVVWLLEKLGIVDKKSSDAKASVNDDPPAQRSSVFLGGADYVSPDGPSPVAFGGGSYKPVTAGSISNSQQNTFNSSYVINAHDGMSQADVLAIMEKNRQQEQFNADLKQRSSVWR
ncbi:phage tail tape measure protein [Erwinia sp. AnSW2-5]|uniref:phage tail tape measure protein n=1 Tax=Erwinia sp. AnSW2-5 TaxID=3367692 RepID=UPI00385EAD11